MFFFFLRFMVGLKVFRCSACCFLKASFFGTMQIQLMDRIETNNQENVRVKQSRFNSMLYLGLRIRCLKTWRQFLIRHLKSPPFRSYRTGYFGRFPPCRLNTRRQGQVPLSFICCMEVVLAPKGHRLLSYFFCSSFSTVRTKRCTLYQGSKKTRNGHARCW